jgi:hypothetical protein
MTTRKNRKRINRKKKTVKGGKNLRDMNMKDILDLFRSFPTKTKNALLRLTSKLPKLPKFTLRRNYTNKLNPSDGVELIKKDGKKSHQSIVNSEKLSLDEDDGIIFFNGNISNDNTPISNGNTPISNGNTPIFDWKDYDNLYDVVF